MTTRRVLTFARRIVASIGYVFACFLVMSVSVQTVFAQFSPEFTMCNYLNTCGYYADDAFCGDEPELDIEDSDDFEKNLKTVYNYFLTKERLDGTKLDKVQAAAIVGNIAHESTGDPMNTQTGYTPDRTKDPNEVSRDSKGNQGGWGLIQWTPSSKILTPGEDGKSLVQKARIEDKPIWQLETQLELVWWHMRETSPLGYNAMVDEFTQTDLMDAVVFYEQKMEGAGVKSYDARYKAAKLALDTYEVSDPTFVSGSSGCQCNTNVAQGDGKTIVLDPGHSGEDRQGKEKDPATGIYIGDSSNTAERKQVWNVAQKIKTTLESNGYRVLLTKDAEDSYANFVQRAAIANEANAALAVSIHNTPGTFGGANDWVTPQKVGGHRTNDSGEKTTFTDQIVADKSVEYANHIIKARQAAGQKGAIMHDLNFTGRPGLSPGNLSAVQLFSKVPWVYNEAGQSGFNEDKYAEGIANGIMAAVPPPPLVAQAKPSNLAAKLMAVLVPKASAQSSTERGCNGAASGDAVQTALNYAWPDYRDSPYTVLKSSYRTAVDEAIKKGLYVGGGIKPGIDCGGFVTRVMQDSGVDPMYNNDPKIGLRNTIGQAQYLSASSAYKRLDTKDARQPGDIAINDGHTYMYVGNGLTGSDENGNPAKFETSIASASSSTSGRDWRTPMAGKESPIDPSYTWYRYVGGNPGESL